MKKAYYSIHLTVFYSSYGIIDIFGVIALTWSSCARTALYGLNSGS